MAKKAYIGVQTEVPIKETTTEILPLTLANLDKIFTVSTETGNSAWTRSDASDGGLKLVPGNIGVNNSTATLTLTAKTDLTNVVIKGAYYTEWNYDQITLTVAGSTVLSAVSGTSAVAQRWSGSLAKDKTIVLTYTKDGSSHASSESSTYFQVDCDDVSIVTETIVGYETKGIARKVKKGYIGVNNVAKKIKKAYIGIGGVARPCWSGGVPEYFGEITYPTVSSYTSSNGTFASHNNQYAVFVNYGGQSLPYSQYDLSTHTSAYDESLTKIDANSLDNTKNRMSTVYAGGNALFGGGTLYAYGTSTSTSKTTVKTVEAYDSLLTKSNLTQLSLLLTYDRATAHVGEKGIFAGGSDYTGDVSDSVEAYDETLTKVVCTGLVTAREGMGSTHIDGYALFAGGSVSSNIEKDVVTVEAFDELLTKSYAPLLNAKKRHLGGTHTKSNALFFSTNSTYHWSEIEVYDDSLTKILLPADDTYFDCLNHVGEFAIVYNKNNKQVEIYDDSLTKTVDENMKPDSSGYTSHVGNNALFLTWYYIHDGYGDMYGKLEVYKVC